jgi:TRAP transporter TAXI family solute receptor
MKLLLARLFRGRQSEKMQQDHSSHTAQKRVITSKGIDIDSLESMMNRRLRTLLLRHSWLVATFAIFVVGGLVGLSIYFTAQPTVMRIAVGPRGTPDVQFAEILADKFKHERASIKLVPVVKDGPVGAMDIVGKPEFDLAVIRSNLAISQDWPVVAILRQNVAVLMVPAPGARDPKKADTKKAKAAKIEKVADLAGRRIGIVLQSEASPDLLRDVLQQYEIPLTKVQVVEVEPQKLKKAIQDNQLDAILVAGPVSGKAIAEAVTAASNGKEGPTFIEIDQAEAIAQRQTAYEKFSIVAGSFGGSPAKPAEDMDSLSFPQYIVARRTFDDGQISTFTKLLYTSRQNLAHALPGVAKIEKPSTDKDSAVLVHPGADIYLGDNQKSFFDKYGDAIFYGLLILPVFGSALAGLAGYLRADTSTRRLRLLHRLIVLAKKARAAETLEALDALQVESDAIVAEGIHQAERDQLDETALITLTMAVNEARLAISDRRAVLLHLMSEPPHVASVRTAGAPRQANA